MLGMNYSNATVESKSQITKEKQDNDQQSSAFQINETSKGIIWTHELYGIKNKAGFIKKPIVLNKEEDYELFLWGDESKILNKSLQIVAENVKSKQKIKIIDSTLLSEYNRPIFSTYKDHEIKPMTNKIKKTAEIKNIKDSTDSNPTSHCTIKLKLPEKGLWKLYIKLDGKDFSYITVDVLETSIGLENLK